MQLSQVVAQILVRTSLCTSLDDANAKIKETFESNLFPWSFEEWNNHISEVKGQTLIRMLQKNHNLKLKYLIEDLHLITTELAQRDIHH